MNEKNHSKECYMKELAESGKSKCCCEATDSAKEAREKTREQNTRLTKLLEKLSNEK